MRVWMCRPLTDAVMARAQSEFDCVIRRQLTPLTELELRQGLTEFDAVIPTLGDAFSAEVFADVPSPRCRLLANFGVGFNHIDAAAARAAGVEVTNTPGAVTEATADIGMMLVLMSARRASEGERMVRQGSWAGWHPTQLLGLHLGGKCVGIVGMGRIGQAIARRCHHGFGMSVRYVSRTEKDLPFPAERSADLQTLAGQVDVMVVSVPGAAETHHLIDASVLAAMRPHAHLINISRGDVVDEAALIEALQSGSIAGAGLDVYEFEPKVPEALRMMEQVTLLPHLGTAAEDVRSNMGHMALDNIAAVAAGRAPPNPV